MSNKLYIGFKGQKYHIDYAIKKDSGKDPPKYYLFFKARDKDVMGMSGLWNDSNSTGKCS